MTVADVSELTLCQAPGQALYLTCHFVVPKPSEVTTVLPLALERGNEAHSNSGLSQGLEVEPNGLNGNMRSGYSYFQYEINALGLRDIKSLGPHLIPSREGPLASRG